MKKKKGVKIVPFRRIHEEIGNSPQSQYLNRYLTTLDAKTVIVEYNYIDPDGFKKTHPDKYQVIKEWID